MPDRIRVWVQPFRDRKALQLQWFDPATKQRRTQSSRTSDPAEAEQKRADLEYELNHGLHSRPVRTGWDAFRQAFEAEYVQALRPNTRRNHAQALNAFEAAVAPSGLASVTQRVLSTYVAGMRARLKPSTIAVRLEFLHTALSWAHEQGMLASVPRFPRVDVPERSPQPVPPELVERLLEACGEDEEARTYLLCAWLAGMRRNEAADLEWEETDSAPWIDFGRRRVVFPGPYVKGCRDQWVPLDPVLQAALESLPRVAPRVFYRRCGQKWGCRVAKLAKQAGVRLTIRSLRRGFACRYAAKVSAQVLMRLMRHASIRTTLLFYANLDAAAEEAVFGTATEPVPGR